MNWLAFYFMSYTLLSETRPKARKQHVCVWCGEKIEVGETYLHEKSVYDGSMQDHKWHIECEKACDEENGCGECEIYPGESERPEERLGFANAERSEP
jgi:hypothetical protein